MVRAASGACPRSKSPPRRRHKPSALARRAPWPRTRSGFAYSDASSAVPGLPAIAAPVPAVRLRTRLSRRCAAKREQRRRLHARRRQLRTQRLQRLIKSDPLWHRLHPTPLHVRQELATRWRQTIHDPSHNRNPKNSSQRLPFGGCRRRHRLSAEVMLPTARVRCAPHRRLRPSLSDRGPPRRAKSPTASTTTAVERRLMPSDAPPGALRRATASTSTQIARGPGAAPLGLQATAITEHACTSETAVSDQKHAPAIEQTDDSHLGTVIAPRFRFGDLWCAQKYVALGRMWAPLAGIGLAGAT